MDYPQFIDKVFSALLWWIPVLVLILLARAPRLKALLAWGRRRRGGQIVLDPDIYRQAHLVSVPTPRGRARIDHVFVSRFGVFAVRTEPAAGWILGAPTERQWTRQYYRTLARFANPLRQLEGHAHALATALRIPADHVHPVVTFVGDTAFKTEMPPNVTRGVGFVDYIRSFQTPVFSEDEVRALAERLQQGGLSPASRPGSKEAPRQAPNMAPKQTPKPAPKRAPKSTVAPAPRAAADEADHCPRCGARLPACEHPAPIAPELEAVSTEIPNDGAAEGRA